MARHDGLDAQGLDLVDGADPLVALLAGVGLAEELVDVAVDDVAADGELEARHVQHGRVVGVGVADLDGAQQLALEVELVGRRQRVREDHRVRDLAGEQRAPHGVERPRLELLFHVRDGPRRGDGAGAGEAALEDREAQEVVAVAVRDVDVREPLAGQQGVDPVGEVVGLRRGDGRVD